MLDSPEPEVLHNTNDINPIQNKDPKLYKPQDSISIYDIEEEVAPEVKVNISSGNMLDNLKSDMASAEVPDDDAEEDTGISNGEDFEGESLSEFDGNSEENEEGFNEEDFEDIADFIISGLSLGGSYLLGWYAMDAKASKYELESKKIKTLKRQLAKVLMRANVKFSFTTVFIGTLILIYSKNFSDAHKHRKEMQEKMPSPEPKPAMKVVRNAAPIDAVPVEVEDDEFEEVPIDVVPVDEIVESPKIDSTPAPEGSRFRIDTTNIVEETNEVPKIEPAKKPTKSKGKPKLKKGESTKINTLNPE